MTFRKLVIDADTTYEYSVGKDHTVIRYPNGMKCVIKNNKFFGHDLHHDRRDGEYSITPQIIKDFLLKK